MKEKKYIVPDNLIQFGYGEDSSVRKPIEIDDTDLYDYYDDLESLESSSNEAKTISPERRNEIIVAIDSLAKEYQSFGSDKEYQPSNLVMIPLHKVLNVASNAVERIFALDYANDAGYQIRGKDLSLVGEYSNYHRIISWNTMNLPEPYSKHQQKIMIHKYFRYKRMEAVLQRLSKSNISLTENIGFEEGHNTLEYELEEELPYIKKTLEDLKKDYTIIRNKLVEHNLRLVYSFFQKNPNLWGWKEQSKDNLATAYMLALDGVNAYLEKEENLQWKISTFIYNHLGAYGEARRQTYNNEQLISISANKREELNKYRKVKRNLEKEMTTVSKADYEGGMHPELEVSRIAIAEVLGYSLDKIKELENLDERLSHMESYDEFQDQMIEESLIDGPYEEGIMKDYDEPIDRDPLYNQSDITSEEDIISIINDNEQKEKLWHIIDKYLSEKERNIIIERFGLKDGKLKTLKEVASKFGISSETVRKIESKVFFKLRWVITNYYNYRSIGDNYESKSI